MAQNTTQNQRMAFCSAIKSYSQTSVKRQYKTIHIYLAFQIGGCLLMHERSAESQLSIAIPISPEWVVA